MFLNHVLPVFGLLDIFVPKPVICICKFMWENKEKIKVL